MRLAFSTILLATMLAGMGAASTFSSAYGYASIYIYGEDINTGETVDLIVDGRTSVQASAFVSSANGIESSRDSSVVTFTNPGSGTLDLYIEIELISEASTTLSDGVVLTDVRYDSNAYVELGRYSTFASTNGSYACSEPDYNVPAFDCFGVYADGYDDVFDTPYDSIGANESLTYELEATAFAFIASTAPVVPLPAGAILLLSALGLLHYRRRT